MTSAPLPPSSGPATARQAPPDPAQEILEATKQVARLLKADDRRFALAGSVAAYAHGVPRRSLHDTDFCILRDDVEGITDTLNAAGLRVWHPPEDWLMKAEYRSCPIDLMFSLSDQPVGRDILDRAEILPVDSVWMPVLAATDLIASQLSSFSEHHCDYGAALPIARTLRERIDWPEIRRRSADRPMALAFLHLLELLDVIPPPDNTDAGRPPPRAGHR